MRASFVCQGKLWHLSLSPAMKASFPSTRPRWVSVVWSGDVPLRSASRISDLHRSGRFSVPSPQLPRHSLPLVPATRLAAIHSETSAVCRRKNLKPISHSTSSMCNDVTFDVVCMWVITARFLDRGMKSMFSASDESISAELQSRRHHFNKPLLHSIMHHSLVLLRKNRAGGVDDTPSVLGLCIHHINRSQYQLPLHVRQFLQILFVLATLSYKSTIC